MDNISIDRKGYYKLKKMYEKSVQAGDTSFMFMDIEILTAYAKYLLQYLQPKFENPALN